MIKKIVAFMIIFAYGILHLNAVQSGDGRVYIRLNTPIEDLQYGNTVELECVTEGIEGKIFYGWQYCTDDTQWYYLDEHEKIYRFILDEENINYYYRVIVTN